MTRGHPIIFSHPTLFLQVRSKINPLFEKILTRTLKCFLIFQLVKNLPAVQETWVQFLGQEDPLEKEVATHSSILAWKMPWTEELGGLQLMMLQKVGHDLATKHHTYF